MNPAPREYNESFYRIELEGQKNRLARLKERQTARQRKSGGQEEAPAAAPAGGRRAQVEAAVLRCLEDPGLPLPCTMGALADRLDSRQAGGASVEEVEEAVRGLARGHPRLEVVLEGGGRSSSVPLHVANVRRRGGEDGKPDDRKRRCAR